MAGKMDPGGYGDFPADPRVTALLQQMAPRQPRRMVLPEMMIDPRMAQTQALTRAQALAQLLRGGGARVRPPVQPL